MILPKPKAPFQKLKIIRESLTIDINDKFLVIPTGNQNILPSYNEYVISTTRCDLIETPAGGLKNSIVQDTFPGSLSIGGNGCYLKNTAGTYTGKTIGAGKLSETSSIVDSGSTGIEFATADGVVFRAADGEPFLIHPPLSIVEEFKVVNISNTSVTYTITIRCPDEINSIELYNIDTGSIETVTFTKVSNSYTFSRTINYNSSEKLQLTIQYQSLSHTVKFTDDANSTTGLQNLSKSFIAFYDSASSEIDFIHFTHRPKNLTFKHESDGTISQITVFPGNGQVYHGRITHSAPTRVSGTGTIPDCLNASIEGSVTKFLQSHGMIVDFSSDVEITTWVVPAISDTKILPFSTIPNDYLGDAISIRASPGEYTPASFVVNVNMDIKLEIAVSDLINGDNSISKDNIDLKVVKCWYQGNYQTSTSNLNIIGRYLTPELLLNDDSFIRCVDDFSEWDISAGSGMANNLRLSDGSYVDLTESGFSSANIGISDATTFQPLIFQKSHNKQLWITLHIPSETIAGTYSGLLTLKSNSVVLKTISMNVAVLPITLLDSPIQYCIYYEAQLVSAPIISTDYRTEGQIRADLQNMLKHGITNPSLRSQPTDEKLQQMLQIRQQEGLDSNRLFYSGLNIDSNISAISTMKSLTTSYGITDLFVYGRDEQSLDDADCRTKIDNINAIGVNVFCSEYIDTYITNIADKLNLVVCGAPQSTVYSQLYHDNDHLIYAYNQPQTTPEFPRTFRSQYGLLLWQTNYDGAIDFSYQFAFGDPWNDFDSTMRDHCFAYPTLNGSINTIQFEGYREATNDVKYITALENIITEAKTRGVDTTDIEVWLASLKIINLSTVNLDDIRSQIIDYILLLQSSENNSAFLTTDGNSILFNNDTQLFTEA